MYSGYILWMYAENADKNIKISHGGYLKDTNCNKLFTNSIIREKFQNSHIIYFIYLHFIENTNGQFYKFYNLSSENTIKKLLISIARKIVKFP